MDGRFLVSIRTFSLLSKKMAVDYDIPRVIIRKLWLPRGSYVKLNVVVQVFLQLPIWRLVDHPLHEVKSQIGCLVGELVSEVRSGSSSPSCVCFAVGCSSMRL